MQCSKDAVKQMIKINVIKSESHLDIEILNVKFYTGKLLANQNINFDIVKKCLENHDFSVKKHTSTDLLIETNGGLLIQLKESGSREWVKVGTMDNIDNIRKAYPSTQYEWGSSHYHTFQTVERVRVDGWNQGTRIWMP